MDIFFTSDHHFGQVSILNFKREDKKTPLRDFVFAKQMDNYMINQWNKMVKPNDKVYHLGDLCSELDVYKEVMPELNGTKILIKGNHDTFKLAQYAKYFKDVRACHKIDKFVLSHIPVHPGSLGSKTIANVHGHLHQRAVSRNVNEEYGTELVAVEDSRYFNVSVERHDYKPVPFDLIRGIYNV